VVGSTCGCEAVTEGPHVASEPEIVESGYISILLKKVVVQTPGWEAGQQDICTTQTP
jgi:hypothetical protein